MSSIVQTVAPACEPITLDQAKAWLRVDGTDEDVLIMGLIEAARTYVETFTRQTLITQQFEFALDGFPAGAAYCARRVHEFRSGSSASREIVIPRTPLASVEGVEYYDGQGVLQTLNPAWYLVDRRSKPGRIVLDEERDWPETKSRPNAVIISFTVGYGLPSQVPQAIRTALRMILCHWFVNRSSVNIGNIVNQIPDSADALLWQHRLPAAY